MENRACKGKSLVEFPTDFCVVDLETTGLSAEYDDILEISAIQVKNGMEINTFSSLCKPENFLFVPEFITELTGITTEMIASAPPVEEVLISACNFISNSIVVGHNVNFDINFLIRRL